MIVIIVIVIDNLFVVLTARELNKNLRIISRASKPSSVKKLKIAGANNVIMPDTVGGSHMAQLVATPDVMEFLDEISRLYFMYRARIFQYKFVGAYWF